MSSSLSATKHAAQIHVIDVRERGKQKNSMMEKVKDDLLIVWINLKNLKHYGLT